MIKENKWKFIISSLITLLPMLFLIPINGVDGKFAKNFGIFFLVMPLIMAALHIFCMFFESRQQRKQEQNKKITNIIFWIVPIISVYVCSLMYALTLGLEIGVGVFMAPLMGVMFIVLGNYMPKARQNHTFGIKIKWTLENEENWNATHRFAGKLWVAIGVILLITAFLPEMVYIVSFMVLIAVAVVACVLYSYRFHKKQVAEGCVNDSTSLYNKNDKKTSGVAIASSVIVLIIVAIIMFTGKLNFTFEQEKLVISANFGGGMEIDYSEIESIDYREAKVDGMRINGFASAKLLYGWFKNDEFGNYIRYTYADSDTCIVLIVDGEEIVIADVDTESTRAMYERLLEEMK